MNFIFLFRNHKISRFNQSSNGLFGFFLNQLCNSFLKIDRYIHWENKVDFRDGVEIFPNWSKLTFSAWSACLSRSSSFSFSSTPSSMVLSSSAKYEYKHLLFNMHYFPSSRMANWASLWIIHIPETHTTSSKWQDKCWVAVWSGNVNAHSIPEPPISRNKP